MKKWMFSILTLFVGLSLVACSNPNQTAHESKTSQSTSQAQTASLEIKFSTDQTSSKEVDFKDGESVMDILQRNYKIEEKDGLITSIDGVKQDPATNTYWMFDVNGELAPKGAKEMKLKNGDTISFYLESFK
ncbi:DUF4430 domain-containing protein [Streptococcus pneumoniae]